MDEGTSYLLSYQRRIANDVARGIVRSMQHEAAGSARYGRIMASCDCDADSCLRDAVYSQERTRLQYVAARAAYEALNPRID